MQITVLADNNIKDARNNENKQAAYFFVIIPLHLIPKMPLNIICSIIKGINKYLLETYELSLLIRNVLMSKNTI